jgi:hypothetical protein
MHILELEWDRNWRRAYSWGNRERIAEQLAAERETLLLGLADHAVQRTPLPRGMRLRFPATAERMRQIDAVVRRERECWPFLEFRVGLTLGGSSCSPICSISRSRRSASRARLSRQLAARATS